MENGKVDWFSELKGFGILSRVTPDGVLEKFYVHITKIVRSPQRIKPGHLAQFEVNPAQPRPGFLPMVQNVTITEPQIQDAGANAAPLAEVRQ